MPSKFRESLWDDSEPLYAPFQKNIRGRYVWIPSKRYRDAGYAIKTFPLHAQGDTEQDALLRAAECRDLTRELMRWWNGEEQSRVEAGTWGWLAQRYLTDAYSQFQEVRAGTQEGYRKKINYIIEAVGEVLIEDTDYQMMMEWTQHMRNNGRSLHYIKAWWTHFGLILSHGVKIQAPGCARVKAIRSEMRIKTPAAKTTVTDRAVVNRIVAWADDNDLPLLSLAVLMRFEFLLRGVDIYGSWAPAQGRRGGIQRDGRIWEGGLTWEMFDGSLTTFEKVISKTRDSLPEPYTFNLTAVPEIRDRLLAIQRKIGPVFAGADGLPLPQDTITRQFARARKALRLPDDLKLMDLRASGITEAKSKVDPFTLRDAAQHSQVGTTGRYVRARSDAANRVIEMRRTK